MSGKREECPKEKSTLSSAWEGKGAMDAYCPGEPELSLLLSRLIYLPFFFFFSFPFPIEGSKLGNTEQERAVERHF